MAFQLEIREDVTAAEWREILVQLLPPGEAWRAWRTPGTRAWELLEGLSFGFARAESRIADMLRELDPQRTVEMIGFWEETAGLPGDCPIAFPTILQARRDAVVGKITAGAVATPFDLCRFAEGYGYEVEITEHQVWRFGESTFSDPLDGAPDWIEIQIQGIPIYFHEMGSGDWTVSDPLALFDDELIQCLIRREAPAQLLYVFGTAEL